MASLVGQQFPADVSFLYIPYTPEKAGLNACGLPQKYDASKEFQNKKVVIVAVPGAFTPTCAEQHIPTFIQQKEALKAKGVDHVIVIAYNDPYVQSAWGKSFGITDDFIIFATDAETKFSKSIGWTLGERTGRYALVVDHGKVIYAEQAEQGGIKGSDAESVLAKL
ncbi:peroxiredoxin type-2 [Cytospora paraplurivora]|uniref:Peroxiredoxin type-2 n=1 Tax=Cytospora paraplurivora TaxID=2898453 RepID=A0AAN9YAG3_9PEZI